MGQIHGPSLGSPACQVTSTGELFVTLSSGGTNINIDNSTNSLTSIGFVQHKINQGKNFDIIGDTTIPSSGGSICFCITAPNTSEYTYLSFNVYANNLIDWTKKDYVTCSGGTRIIPENSNRNSINEYSGSLSLNPQVTGGSLTKTGFFGAPGANPNQQGIQGQYGTDNKVILRSGTEYSYCFKAAGDNTKIGWDAEFYEHADVS